MSDRLLERNRLWARLDQAVAQHPEPLSTPIAVVDLDAFDRNADDLLRRAAGTPIRVASKSLRVPALISRALARDGFEGVLSYTLGEALWLHEQQICSDIVVGYPSVDPAALAKLFTTPSALDVITLMIDDPAHLDAIDATRPRGAGDVRIAIDLDAGLRMANQSVGPKRSPLFATDDIVALARTVLDRPGFTLVGVMTYEGHVAGVPDDVPGQAAKSLVVRRMKKAALGQLRTRRESISKALGELVELEFWNAGGSGSLAESRLDPAVTELAAGSGLLVPGLFDHYRSFIPEPAAFFGLRVSRRPAPGVVTVHGGGLIASGPVGPDRAPLPWAPPGLSLTGMEGAGEVQTPLTGHPADLLQIGDLVWFRHAKSGELFEHVRDVHLLQGERLTEVVSSYRGRGQAF